jgi:hypothetical protein
MDAILVGDFLVATDAKVCEILIWCLGCKVVYCVGNIMCEELINENYEL